MSLSIHSRSNALSLGYKATCERKADKRFDCPMLNCNIRFTSSVDLLAHVSSDHQTPPFEFKPGVHVELVIKSRYKKKKAARGAAVVDALPSAATASSSMDVDVPLVQSEGKL